MTLPIDTPELDRIAAILNRAHKKNGPCNCMACMCSLVAGLAADAADAINANDDVPNTSSCDVAIMTAAMIFAGFNVIDREAGQHGTTPDAMFTMRCQAALTAAKSVMDGKSPAQPSTVH